MRSRALEVEAQLQRSVSVMGARYCYLGSESYHYFGSGSGSCYFQKHYALPLPWCLRLGLRRLQSRSTPVAQSAPHNLLTRWDVSSIPANGIFLTKN